MANGRDAGAGSGAISEVSSDLATQVQQIITRQVALARHELRDAARGAAQGGVLGAAGGLAVVTGAVFLGLGAVYALRRAMPDWAAAGLVGTALIGLGGAAGAASVRELSRVAGDAMPATRETLREHSRELAAVARGERQTGS
jgi:hypothetical protein